MVPAEVYVQKWRKIMVHSTAIDLGGEKVVKLGRKRKGYLKYGKRKRYQGGKQTVGQLSVDMDISSIGL